MTPPNLREVDCCATCENGGSKVRDMLPCIKEKTWVHEDNICDNFKREECT